MTFSIRATDLDKVGTVFCELIIDLHTEVFPLGTTLWTRETYESQWMAALNALVKESVKNCVLVTDIQSPLISVGIAYWALFRESDVVYFQERFSRELTTCLLGLPHIVEQSIPPRKQGRPEEQARVSEWAIPVDAISAFIRGRDS